jgi:hypothetical protein
MLTHWTSLAQHQVYMLPLFKPTFSMPMWSTWSRHILYPHNIYTCYKSYLQSLYIVENCPQLSESSLPVWAPNFKDIYLHLNGSDRSADRMRACSCFQIWLRAWNCTWLVQMSQVTGTLLARARYVSLITIYRKLATRRSSLRARSELAAYSSKRCACLWAQIKW